MRGLTESMIVMMDLKSFSPDIRLLLSCVVYLLPTEQKLTRQKKTPRFEHNGFLNQTETKQFNIMTVHCPLLLEHISLYNFGFTSGVQNIKESLLILYC